MDLTQTLVPSVAQANINGVDLVLNWPLNALFYNIREKKSKVPAFRLFPKNKTLKVHDFNTSL